jgi:hypothetical protein
LLIQFEKPPISKISRAKWTGGMAQAVELLLCKYEVLSSNPRPIKKKKKPSPFLKNKAKSARGMAQMVE